MTFNFNIHSITPVEEGGGGEVKNQNKTITENGVYTADSGYTGLGRVTVDVETTEPTLATLTITPSKTAQTLIPPSGTDGYNTVSVNAVTASIDSDIIAGNIKKDVEILGVTGTYEGTVPSGTITITQNGTSDVSNYASAEVSVSGGSFIGIPREVASRGSNKGLFRAIQETNYNFTFPNEATILKGYGLYFAFRQSIGLKAVDFNNINTINGAFACDHCFHMCDNLESINMSKVTTISGNNALNTFASTCGNLTSVDLSGLQTIGSGSNIFSLAFEATKLTTLSFPELKTIPSSSPFGFMLSEVNSCTVHFPSNLQTTISAWSDTTTGFGGINTTVLFDLPATA